MPKRENTEPFTNVCSAFYYSVYLAWAFQGELRKNLLDIQEKIIFTLVHLYTQTHVNSYFFDKLKCLSFFFLP